jgi:hypothetical protein
MTRKNRRNIRNDETSTHNVPLDDDAISRVLEALQQELPPEDEVDLDTLFSDVLSRGLLSERDIDNGFEAFLNRTVRHDPVSNCTELVPITTPTIGERVRQLRVSRNLTLSQTAAELHVPIAWIEALEASEEPYEFSDLFPTAKRLSVSLHAQLHECVTFLQRLRVIDTIGRTDGVTLKAARKISNP